MTKSGIPFGGSNRPAPLPDKLVADRHDEPHENRRQTPILRSVALYHCLNNVSSESVVASVHPCGSPASLLPHFPLCFGSAARRSDFMNRTKGVCYATNQGRRLRF